MLRARRDSAISRSGRRGSTIRPRTPPVCPAPSPFDSPEEPPASEGASAGRGRGSGRRASNVGPPLGIELAARPRPLRWSFASERGAEPRRALDRRGRSRAREADAARRATGPRRRSPRWEAAWSTGRVAAELGGGCDGCDAAAGGRGYGPAGTADSVPGRQWPAAASPVSRARSLPGGVGAGGAARVGVASARGGGAGSPCGGERLFPPSGLETFLRRRRLGRPSCSDGCTHGKRCAASKHPSSYRAIRTVPASLL